MPFLMTIVARRLVRGLNRREIVGCWGLRGETEAIQYMYGILQAYVPAEGCITRDRRKQWQTPADYKEREL